MGLETREFYYLQQFMAQHAAFVLDDGKGYMVESRLTPLAYQEGMESVQQLLEELQRRSFGGLHRKVLDAMVNNETWFFRDFAPFEALRKAILPDLLAERAGSRRLRLWSAASSSGQEAYSMAMLIDEELRGLPGWTVEIVGTDISKAILERARTGRYSQLEVNRGLPANYLAKYFTRSGQDWVLCPTIREKVQFRELNLAGPWRDLPKFDVIFIRNVMIYFGVEKKREIYGRLISTLQPDGYLMLGTAESPYALTEAFTRVPFDKTAYYRLRT